MSQHEFKPGMRVNVTWKAWPPGKVVSIEEARKIEPFKHYASNFVYVLHDDGRIGAWIPGSLTPVYNYHGFAPGDRVETKLFSGWVPGTVVSIEDARKEHSHATDDYVWTRRDDAALGGYIWAWYPKDVRYPVQVEPELAYTDDDLAEAHKRGWDEAIDACQDMLDTKLDAAASSLESALDDLETVILDDEVEYEN